MTPDTRLRREALPFQVLGAETIVVHPGTREVHVLSGSGAAIWDLLAEERSFAELCARLDAEFDGPAERIEAEAARFVAELVGKGLLAMPAGAAR